MRRILIPSIGLALLCAAPCFAQTKATIQNVPEIPFTPVPNFLKTPASDILGESVAVERLKVPDAMVAADNAITALTKALTDKTQVAAAKKTAYETAFATAVTDAAPKLRIRTSLAYFSNGDWTTAPVAVSTR